MPQNKTPEVFGLTSTPGGRHMGFSTVAPGSYSSAISFQIGDFVIDPYASAPGMWVCTVAGAGGTATFVRAGSTNQSGSSFSALSVTALTVSSSLTASSSGPAIIGSSGSTQGITLSGANIRVSTHAADKIGFFGVATLTTQLVSTDTTTVEAIRILKALGFCTT